MFRVFSDRAELYSKNKSVQAKTARVFIDKMTVPKDAKILDCGCGDGETTRYMAEKHQVQVVGIDRDRKMLEVAQVYISPQVVFTLLDVAKLSANKEFEILTCFWVLHWVANQNVVMVLQNFYRALKDNGELHLIIRLPGSVTSVAMDALIQTEKWKHYFTGYKSSYNSFGAQDYKLALLVTGFQDLDLEETTTGKVEFETDQRYIDYLLPITDMLTYIIDPNPIQQDKLRKEFLDNLVAKLRRDLGLRPCDKLYNEVPILRGMAKRPMLCDTQEGSSSQRQLMTAKM